MKSSTGVVAGGAGVVLVWFWNTLLPAAPWFNGLPPMPGEVAAVLTPALMALGARFIDRTGD